MGENTGIEWCDHTLNFWWGCTEVSPACANCYARELSNMRSQQIFGAPVVWGRGGARRERLVAARRDALKWNRRAESAAVRPRVFVNSMSDWLDDDVPTEWLAWLLTTIWMCRDLDFILLSKRPGGWYDRMRDVIDACPEEWVGDDCPAWVSWLQDWMFDFKPPANVWIGTTVENQEWGDKRIPLLLKIPARVRFVSCEPLLGPVDLQYSTFNGSDSLHSLEGIGWVICGGESGGKARAMHPDWALSLRDQCKQAGVPFLFKQWGEWCPATEEFGVTGSMMPDTGEKYTWIGWDGKTSNPSWRGLKAPIMAIARQGKKRAGRMLNGVEHNEFPTVKPPTKNLL